MNSDKFQELVLQHLQALTDRLGAVEKGQELLATGQQRLESKMDNIELRMENEVIDRIRGLFDAREVQNDRFDRIEEKLGSIETDTGYLVARVARLEHVAK